jgi:hypothetical protein
MVRGRVNDVEMNPGISFDSDRQVKHSTLAYSEKPKAVITLKELFGEKSDTHSAACCLLEKAGTLGFQFQTGLTTNYGGKQQH